MLTIENAKLFLEHAPPPRPRSGDLVGWRLQTDGGTICDDCASRICGRGCDFTGVVPIFRAAALGAIACETCGAVLLDL